MARSRNSRFRAGSGVYTCRLCGKRTRETGECESGVGLCKRCMDVCGYENMVNDGNMKLEEVPAEYRSEVSKLVG